jgi:transcriptional regulator with XRE-family HTH domain
VYGSKVARTFGQNLKRIREAKGVTQEALMGRLGLKRPTPISLWESRPTLPKAATIVRIAKALGCAPRDLLDEVETDYDRLRLGLPLRQVKARDPGGARSVKARRASSQ